MERNQSRLACWGLSVAVAIRVVLGSGPPALAKDTPRETPADAEERSLLETALSRDLSEVREIIFCTRGRYDDGHWYANIGYYCDDEARKAYPGNGRPDASRLLALDVRSGEVRPLLDAKGGTVRDPQIHYDAQRVLFSYRPAGTEHFHLYEIGLDGSDLRQLTSGECDDYEPTYLPDGTIVFVSTRCNRWVNCWMTQVGVLHRCAADGSDIRLVSANTEHDNTPWVMPDGRILYTRWEYVDRSQVEFHHLWTMNPDGTAQMVYYGNMHPRILMIDAKPVPGTDQVIASFSPGHGVNEHAGIATVVSPSSGPDAVSSARGLHRGKLTRDPYAVSADCFLVARDKQIVLLDGSGREQVLYTHRGAGGVHEPRPVLRRPRERVVPDRVDKRQSSGVMVLADVYNGRNLTGVKRGDIKKLLVLESLPKPVNFSGGPDLLSWLGTFTLERVLGTVPVEEDGSAHFEVPAYRQVFFVALDENDLSVKRMQSFSCVMPGERLSCAGCHEDRTRAPQNRPLGRLQALSRPPSVIQPFADFPDVLDFQRDVQPILDRRCVECHGYSRCEGGVVLEGDLGPQWSHSYFSLFARRQVADGRNGLGNQPPRTIGSSASALLAKVGGDHYGVTVSPKEWRTLWLWIESGAPYAGTYAALRNEAEQARAGAALARVMGGMRDVLQRRCHSCHSPDGVVGVALPYHPDFQKRNRSDREHARGIHERTIYADDPVARYSPHILVNFTRPHLSPIVLAPLAREAGGFGCCGVVFRDRNDSDCETLVEAVRAGKEVIDAEPRFATPGFRPNRQYIRELKRYGILPEPFDAERSKIDPYETDRSYWRSFWYRQDASRTAEASAPAPRKSS